MNLYEVRHLLLGQDVFISYRWNKDPRRLKYSQELAKTLENRGLDCFVDTKRITAGDDISYAIKRAIKKSKLFVLVTTEDITLSPWVPKELEQARNEKCKIIPINISGAIQSESLNTLPWNTLKNLDWIEESEEALNSSNPSDNVSLKIDESFKGKRNKARLTQTLLAISVAILLLISVPTAYSWYLASKISEQTEKLESVNKEIKEKDTVINGKDEEITNKTKDLTKLQTDLGKASKDLNKANKDRDNAISRQREEEKKAVEANNKRKDAETKEQIAKKNAYEFELRTQGSRGGLLAKQRGQEFKAVEIALGAAEKSLLVMKTLPTEIRNGLVNSITATDYSKALQNDLGEITFAQLSPNSELIFGEILDSQNNQLIDVIWESKTGNILTILEKKDDPANSDNEIGQAAFSPNGNWLLIIDWSGTFQLWKIDKRDSNYQFIRTIQPNKSAICESEFNGVNTISISNDGGLIAIKDGGYSTGSSRVPQTVKLIKTANLTIGCFSESVPLPPNSTNFNIDNFKIDGITFTWTNELLIIANPLNPDDWSFVYNATTQDFMCECNGRIGDSFFKVTESGDIVSLSYDDVLVFNPNEKDCKVNYIAKGFRGSVLSANYYQGQFKVVAKALNSIYLSEDFKYENYNILRVESIFNSGKYSGNSILSFLTDDYLAFQLNDHTSRVLEKQSNEWKEAILPLTNAGTAGIVLFSQSKELFSDVDIAGNSIRSRYLKNNQQFECKVALGGFSNSYTEHKQILSASFIPDTELITLLELTVTGSAPLEKEELTVSIYDPVRCQLIKQINLLVGNNSKFISKGYEEFVYKAVISGNKAISTDVMRNTLNVRVWNLSEINLQNNNQTMISPIHEDSIPIVNIGALSLSVEKGGMIFTINKKGKPSVFAFKNNRLTELELESNVSELGSQTSRFTAFSKSGNLVASAYSDQTISIWSIQTGKKILTLEIPNLSLNEPSMPFAISLDDKSIAISCSDGNIRIYPILEQEYIDIARKMLSR